MDPNPTISDSEFISVGRSRVRREGRELNTRTACSPVWENRALDEVGCRFIHTQVNLEKLVIALCVNVAIYVGFIAYPFFDRLLYAFHAVKFTWTNSCNTFSLLIFCVLYMYCT